MNSDVELRAKDALGLSGLDPMMSAWEWTMMGLSFSCGCGAGLDVLSS